MGNLVRGVAARFEAGTLGREAFGTILVFIAVGWMLALRVH